MFKLSLFLVFAVACSEPPKTYDSMLKARLADPQCRRTCPLGQHLTPVEPQAEHILDDCCYDPGGLTWSSCAWNASGQFMSLAQLVAPERFASFGACGGPGWPDCPEK